MADDHISRDALFPFIRDDETIIQQDAGCHKDQSESMDCGKVDN